MIEINAVQYLQYLLFQPQLEQAVRSEGIFNLNKAGGGNMVRWQVSSRNSVLEELLRIKLFILGWININIYD